MKSGLNIFKMFEELAFEKPGVTQVGYIIYDDLGNINNIKYYNIGEPSLKPILEEKQPGVKQTDRGEDIVMLKVITEVVKSKKSSCKIELPLPNLKDLTVKQRVALENCFAEAGQLINEREEKGEDEEIPLAPTEYLKKAHEEVIKCNAGSSEEFENLEEIFAL